MHFLPLCVEIIEWTPGTVNLVLLGTGSPCSPPNLAPWHHPHPCFFVCLFLRGPRAILKALSPSQQVGIFLSILPCATWVGFPSLSSGTRLLHSHVWEADAGLCSPVRGICPHTHRGQLLSEFLHLFTSVFLVLSPVNSSLSDCYSVSPAQRFN